MILEMLIVIKYRYKEDIKTHKDFCIHKGVLMVRYTLSLELCGQLKLHRTWCDRQQ